MGKILTINGIVFFIYSSDQFEDRLHIHVRDGNQNLAKFWLEPEVELFRNDGFSTKELNKIRKLVEEHKEELIKKLNKLYGREKKK